MRYNRLTKLMQTDKNEANIYILSVLLIGIFIAMGINIWIGLRTFIYFDTLFHILLFIGFFAMALHYVFFRHWDRYLAEIFAYNFIGWGNIGLAILLSINYFFHDQPKITKYPINKNITLLSINTAGLKIEIKDDELKNYPHMLTFDEAEIHGQYTDGKIVASEAIFTTANGFLGYKILLDKELY